MTHRRGNNGNSERLHFWGAPKSLQMVPLAMKLKGICSLEEKLSPTQTGIKTQTQLSRVN